MLKRKQFYTAHNNDYQIVIKSDDKSNVSLHLRHIIFLGVIININTIIVISL